MPRKPAAHPAKVKRKAKSASARASEFVRAEIHHVREGKHGARSVKQMIAIGLSKARRAGVALPVPRNASTAVRKQAERDAAFAHSHRKVSPARSRASRAALAKEGKTAGSHAALSRHAREVAKQRKAARAHPD